MAEISEADILANQDVYFTYDMMDTHLLCAFGLRSNVFSA